MDTQAAERINDDVRAQWDRMAKGWSDNSVRIRPWLHDATQAMLTMAAIGPGSRVLDVAAGAGDQTLDIAARVGPAGHVLATDVSPEILRLAGERVAAAGLSNVETRVCAGERLSVADAVFDAAVCRLGLMLFADPLQALREIHRSLKPGGGFCSVVFSAPDKNPCIVAVVSTAFKHAGLPPRDPFLPGGLLSLGKPGLIDELFARAGFRDVATTRMAAPFTLPAVADYLDFIKSAAAPIVALVERLEPARREAAWLEIADKLRTFETGSGWEGPNELLLTAARK